MITNNVTLLILTSLILLSCDHQNTITNIDIVVEDQNKINLEDTNNEIIIDTNYLAINKDSTVNAIIEIPAGTHAKWEVDKSDSTLKHTQKDGQPRMINYLSYPANYGMIPQSILPSDKGGDGDPLDIIIIGQKIDRGELVACHLIGMLNLLDNGEQDDKLIAVPLSGTFSDVKNLRELNKKYPGVVTILETWFSNYKGPHKMELLDTKDRAQAMKVLEYAVQSYSKK